MQRLSALVLAISGLTLAGCIIDFSEDGVPQELSDAELGVAVPTDEELRQLIAEADVTPLEKPSLDAAKVALGQVLFFDKILSGNRNISCATCHSPALGTGDGLPLSIGEGGVGAGPDRSAPLDEDGNPIFIARHAPVAFGMGGLSNMFWDGKVEQNDDGSIDTPAGDDFLPGVENAAAAQSMFPVTSRAEMRGQPGDNELADIEDGDFRSIWAGLMARLLAIDEYRTLFAEAYPDVPESDLTFAHAGNAIAAFEIDRWTLNDTPFDDYLGGDNDALTDAQKRGAAMFFGKFVNCSHCHSGPLLTDGEFHNIGVPEIGPGKGDGENGTSDFGRERVTGNPEDRFRFRTPPLRNCAVSGPWMHTGAFDTLEAIVEHYDNPEQSLRQYDGSHLPSELQEQIRTDQIENIVATLDQEMMGHRSGLGRLSEGGFLDLVIGGVAPDRLGDLVAFLESLTSPSIGVLAERDTPENVPSGLPVID